MKKILFALTVVLFFATSVSANAGSSYTLGGTTYFTNDDGSTGNMYNLGGTTYTKFQQTPSYTAPVYAPVYVPVTPTLTIEQQCKKQYGTLSYANNSLCYCSQGSEWNTAQSQCIQSVTCLDGVRINRSEE